MRFAFNPKWVNGKRIKEFRVATWKVEGVLMHLPEIELENGALIRFLAEEAPDGGEYGILPIYLKPEGSK